MIVLTLVWSTIWTLGNPLSQDPLVMITGKLSSEHNTAAWSQGSYVTKKNGFSLRFSNLSTIMSPTFYRYELLIRTFDSTLDIPSVYYRNKNHLIELQMEQDFQDEKLWRIPLSKDIVYGIPSGLRLGVSKTNLDTHDTSTPLLVAYGSDSDKIDMAEFLQDSSDGESRMKRNVRTNMVDSDDTIDTPCHKEDLWLDFRTLGRLMHPTEVNIKQCVGTCSRDLVRESKGAYNHTLMQAYLSKKKPKSVREPSCCVPLEYESESFYIYKDSQTVSREEIQNLIVTKCGCR